MIGKMASISKDQSVAVKLEGKGVKQGADDITVKGVNYMQLEMHMCLVCSWQTPYF